MPSYRVTCIVEDTTLVGSKNKKEQRTVRVTAGNESEARDKAVAYYKRNAYKNIHVQTVSADSRADSDDEENMDRKDDDNPFKRGDKVKDNYGERFEVIGTSGNMVKVWSKKKSGGDDYHYTKLHRADSEDEKSVQDRLDTMTQQVNSLGQEAAKIASRLDASDPLYIVYRGSKYYRTGKTGTRISNGKRAAEYEEVDKSGNKTGRRVWRETESGEVYPE